MLKISETQLQAFERQQAESFTLRVAAFLKVQFPEYRSLPQAQMIPAIDQFIARATSYELETEREIIAFVLAAHYLGGDFDTKNLSCKTVLKDSSRAPEWKANWLEAMALIIEGKREKGEL